MKIIDAVQALDQALTQAALHHELIICGGAALHLQGISSRETKDIDVLIPVIDDKLKNISYQIAAEQNLAMDWLNNGPKSLIYDLEQGWEQNTIVVYRGKSLVIRSLGRGDLLFSKLYAMCDRKQDIVDLLAMKITREEVKTIKERVKQMDSNPDWPMWVDICMEELLQEINDG